MKITFNPYQFILSMLFLIPGLILIAIYTNWYVAIGVWLVGIAVSIKVETKDAGITNKDWKWLWYKDETKK